jgi:hypothetical protein
VKIVDMKADSDDTAQGYAGPTYPSGLRLYLDEDLCERLGITKTLKPGTVLTISAKAVVESSTEALERDGDDAGNDVSLQLQITDLGCQPAGAMRNAAAELYKAG